MSSVRFVSKYGETISCISVSSVPRQNDIVIIGDEKYVVVNVASVIDGIYNVVVEIWKDVNGGEDY